MHAAQLLPPFVRDLLASPPHRGGGLNLWFYRVARLLHPYRDPNEIINLLRAATGGEPIKHGEIERAVERSKLTARQPGQPYSGPTISPWPTVDKKLRAEIIRGGGGLSEVWRRLKKCLRVMCQSTSLKRTLLGKNWPQRQVVTRNKHLWPYHQAAKLP